MAMNRRKALGVVGLTTAAGILGSAAAPAGEHDHPGSQLPRESPLDGVHLYLCGVHVAKGNPKIQVVTHHLCTMRDEIHQCLLYDTVDKNARLIGVEYIISDERYQQLPTEEKRFWHPHAYEVMSGVLVAPTMKPEEEKKLMKAVLPTWGKTWQTWPDLTSDIPMGAPLLMWAVTADGQMDKAAYNQLEQQCKLSIEQVRERRKQQLGLPMPTVAQPKSIDFIGRQWTNEGADTPEALLNLKE